MGKASHTTTTMNLTTKKKGRPSRQDLLNRALLQSNPNSNSKSNPNSHFTQNPNLPPRRSRSTRRIPILYDHHHDSDHSHDHYDDYDDDDDDDERVEKKVKLVRRLPSSSSFPNSNFSDLDYVDAIAEDEKGTKATDILNGTGTSMLCAGPTTCTAAAAGGGATTTTTTTTSLPDKKLLLLILDKLQKKDTRGVFAEPVDPEELPDYHEIIENPMDFGTVKKNLDGGLYSTLEQLEADINLICSNAMQYNAPSTIYFRQARSIQELAKKEFETLRQDGGQSEPPPRPRRGRPPGSRNLKKLLESSSVERSVPESSPDTTPASREDDATRSNSYNLRKGPSLYRFPRNLEFFFESPASASKSTSTKHVKIQYESDESRRETYNLSGQSDSGQDPSLLATFETFENGLIPVGLGSNHSYARSLAQFAADLGPVVWRIVSKKIRSVLPPGVEFGPGWVGENKALSVQLSSPQEKADSVLQDSCMSKPHYPLNSGFPNSTVPSIPSAGTGNENSLEARGLSSCGEWPSLKGSMNGVVGTGSPYQIQRDPVVHSGMNGFNGGFGTGLHIQEGVSRPTAVSFNHSQPPKLHPMESSSFEASRNSSLSRMHSSPIDFHSAMNMENDPSTLPYWQSLSMQERWDNLNLAEPMVGFQASSSRSSRMPIGSPPQLDLVLQL